jgi:hypothetical protein
MAWRLMQKKSERIFESWQFVTYPVLTDVTVSKQNHLLTFEKQVQNSRYTAPLDVFVCGNYINIFVFTCLEFLLSASIDIM